ncbi:MAG TPA: aminopeptidase [Gemmatimonadaceae bacterium]
MTSPARIVRRTLLGIVLVVVAFAALTPVGRYLSRAAWQEGKILARRQPIAKLVASPGTDARTRAKLQLVLAARAFAADSLGLAADESFTTYSRLDSDTLVLVLAGAYRDRLRSYTWWFPIVGRVPYKGYFSVPDAKAAARDLEDKGLDTYLRPASAFSTLGWFADPLVSSTLHEDSVRLANTVIHELTHNTFYASGQTVFNESFANFVGAHGAMLFFRSRGDSVHFRESEDDWARDRLIGAFWQDTFDALDSAFRAHPESKAARLAARDTVFAHEREHFMRDVLPQLPGVQPGVQVRLDLNNAILLSRRVYRTGLDLFDDVLVREGGDLRKAFAQIVALAKSRPEDPYGAVRDWLGVAGRGSGAPGAEPAAHDRAQVERR